MGPLWGRWPALGVPQEDGLNQQACFGAGVPVRHGDSLRVALSLPRTLLSPATLFIWRKPFKSHGFWVWGGLGGLVWISGKLPYQQMRN